PGAARLRQALPLNRPGSAKDTRHVILELDGAARPYKVGDSLGVAATNDPALVEAIMARLRGSPELEVACPDGRRPSLAKALHTVWDTGGRWDQAIGGLASRAPGPGEGDRLQALAEGYPGAEPADADLLELLETFPSARPPIQELVLALGALQPRLYSIAS